MGNRQSLYRSPGEKELRILQKNNSDLLLKKGEETRKYRHDMNHHISCLYQIAQKEEAGQTIQYLEKIQNNLLAIRNMNYGTGLEVLDLLLNVLLVDLPHVEIRVEGKCYKETVLDNVESCIIFSNLPQSYKNNFSLKVPMNFNGNVLCYMAV